MNTVLRPLVQTLRLSVPALLGVVVFTYQFWVYLIVFFMSLAAGVFSIPALIGVFSFLLLGFLFYCLLGIVWRFTLKILIAKSPLWVQPSKDIKTILFNFSVLLAATASINIIQVVKILESSGMYGFLSVLVNSKNGSIITDNLVYLFLSILFLYMFSRH